MLFKRSLLLLLFSICILSCKKQPFVPNTANALPGLWKQLGNFPGTGRVRAYGFTIGNKGYMLGGNSGSGFNLILLNDLWEYDPTTDKWTRKADYPGQAAEYVRGFTINGKAYMGTGFGRRLDLPGDNLPQNNDFWEYDPTADKWTRKADFAGVERENVIAFELNGAGYMGLGTNNAYDQNYKDFYRYDAAADKWTRVADYPGTGSFGIAAFALNGKGYAGTGGAAPNAVALDFWQYDPIVDKWIAKAGFTGKGRAFVGQFVIGTDGYVGLGSTAVSPLDDWYKYDSLTDSWLKITPFGGGARYDVVSFALNGIGYAGTGNPGQLTDIWKYTPSKN